MELPPVPIAEHDPYAASAKSLLGLFDTPAYLRRALAVEHACQALLTRCARQREEWLEPVRMRLRNWRCVRSRRPHRCPVLADETAAHVRRLTDELLAAVPDDPDWLRPGRPVRVWKELQAAVRRFNGRWGRFLDVVDLDRVNARVAGYNAHYLTEKEAALGSPQLARRGFRPMAPLTRDWLRWRLPPLPDLGPEGRR